MQVSKKILTEDDRLELWMQNILSIIKEVGIFLMINIVKLIEA